MYEPQESISQSILDEAEWMYLDAYFHPKLHEGLSLKEIGLDSTSFISYEDFIADMFHKDFASYRFSAETPRFYLQAREVHNGKIVGVCVSLQESPGCYYIDHLGVDCTHRQRKIGSTLIQPEIQHL